MKTSLSPPPPTTRRTEGRDLALAASLFAVACLAYFRTMHRSFGWGDTSELITSAYFLAVGHSPGYPTWMLLAYPIAHLPLGPSVAWRVNVWNACLGAAAVALLYFVFLGLVSRRPAAAVGALAFGFTRTFWGLTAEADVFTLHICLTAGLLLAALRWRRQPTDRAWCAAALLIGLGLTNHPLTLLLVPGLVAWVWAEQGGRYFTARRVAMALGCVLLAVSLYAYVPLRGHANPPPHLYHPQSLSEVWNHVTAPAARRHLFDQGLPIVAQRVGLFVAGLPGEFGWPALLLGGVGIVLLARRDRRMLLLLGAIAAVDLVYASSFSVSDAYLYFLPMYLVWAACLSVGADGLLALAGRATQRVAREALSPLRSYGAAAALLFAVPALAFSANLRTVDRRDDHDPERFAQAVLQQVPQHAVILGDWWKMAPLVYLRHVAGQRPDLSVFPAASLPSDDQFLAYTKPGFFSRYSAVYFAEGVTHRETLLRRAGCLLVPEGPVTRVYRQRPDSPWVRAEGPARVQARFGHELGLVKADVPREPVQPGHSVAVTLSWVPLEDYRGQPREVALVLRQGTSPGIWFESAPLGHDLYPRDQWPPAHMLTEQHWIYLPDSEPPGDYDLLLRVRPSQPAGTTGAALPCDHPLSATAPTVYRVARLRVTGPQEP